MEWLMYIIAAIVGFIAMVSGGFWGLGGGWLIVPCLLLMGVPLPVAVAASLLQMIASSFYTVLRQFPHIGWEKGGWGWTVAVPLSISSFIGALFGAPLSNLMERVFHSHLPHQCFYIVILGWILIKFLSNDDNAADNKPSMSVAKSITIISVAGYFIGVLAALLGIGGGSMTRPLMRLVVNVPEKTTAQIARLSFFLTALSGSVPYLCDTTMPYSYVAGIAVMLSIGGMIGFPLGAKMHHIVLSAGKQAFADKGFAMVLGIVIFSIICKITGIVLVGRIAIIFSGLGLLAFLIAITLKSKSILKKMKGISAS
ncbi:MAG: hypothetical protein A2X49_04885 [Lentisphaerae bacterium GWF2_52_8]|nr:MAG: hypothetical protein A2X49_04885 [Lentisphaerae bacterium GWF2_52_8]